MNQGNFRCFFETTCKGDTRLQRHCDAQLIFNGTYSTVVQHRMNCYEVYRFEIAKQLYGTSFVTIQSEETSAVSGKSQMVLTMLCYTQWQQFVEVKDKSGETYPHAYCVHCCTWPAPVHNNVTMLLPIHRALLLNQSKCAEIRSAKTLVKVIKDALWPHSVQV